VSDLCGYFLPLVNAKATSKTIFSLSVFKIIRALLAIDKLFFRGTGERERGRERGGKEGEKRESKYAER
jgi:hypothetical protein